MVGARVEKSIYLSQDFDLVFFLSFVGQIAVVLKLEMLLHQ